jgi:hypothetical protein
MPASYEYQKYCLPNGKTQRQDVSLMYDSKHKITSSAVMQQPACASFEQALGIWSS